MAVKKKKAATKAKPKTKSLGPKEVAALLNVPFTKPLTPAQISRLRKALPGYVGTLDDSAKQLEEDLEVLGLKDVSPERLLEVHAAVTDLMAKEAVAEAVYTSIYHQRMLLDDEGMGMLLKVARRINAVSEDDPALTARWRTLLNFLGGFRKGGRRPKGDAPPEG
jgi:hypothetical protein